MTKITLGSDPELMLKDWHNNKIVSAIPILKNTKNNPVIMDRGVRMYADNVLVEAAFPPSLSRWEAVDRIRDAFTQMQGAISDRYKLQPRAAHEYDADELHDKAAWQAGCDPNFDVWRDGISNDLNIFKDGIRSGSFHIHVGVVGWEDMRSGILIDDQSKLDAVKLMDIFVGIPSVVFDRDDTSILRRKLYGKAGEFRPCDYGVEYRVLGPYALRDPELTDLSFMLVEYAMERLAAGEAKEILSKFNPADIQEAINNDDKGMAKEIMLESGLPAFYTKRVLAERDLDPNLEMWGIN